MKGGQKVTSQTKKLKYDAFQATSLYGKIRMLKMINGMDISKTLLDEIFISIHVVLPQ